MKLSCTLKHMTLKFYFVNKVQAHLVSTNVKTSVSLSEYTLDCFTLRR